MFEKLFLSPDAGRMFFWMGITVAAICAMGCVAAIIEGNILMFVLSAAAAIVFWLTCHALRVIVVGRSTLPPPNSPN